MTEAGRRNNDERRYDDSAGLKIRQLLENTVFFFRPNEEEKNNLYRLTNRKD